MTSITREESKSCVGAGWSTLLDEIYDALPEETYVAQVKEKFGGLRFYVGSTTTEVLDMISAVEAKSLKTCERCGEPGRTRGGGWIKTLCDTCDEEEKIRMRAQYSEGEWGQ